MPIALTIDRLDELVGITLPPTRPRQITQAAVDAFADLTGDRQWIHVDVGRAEPFGGTIVHGLLLTGLIGGAWGEWLDVVDASDALNYGVDRIRFLRPVPVGSEVALAATFAELSTRVDGARLSLDVEVLVDGITTPAVVARSIVLFRR